MKRIIFIIAISIVVGCNNKVKEEKPVIIDSLQMANGIAKEDSSRVFSSENIGWLESVIPKAPTGTNQMELEEFWNLDSFDFKETPVEPDFYKTYHTVLRWSPDSTWILDIGSYGSFPVKDSKGNIRLEGGEPDTEVALILPNNNQRARLMFVGPSSQIINGKWINDQELMVLGTSYLSAEKNDTLLWMINVKDKFFRLYNFNQKR